MGLFGFLGDMLGSQNTYHADPMNIPQHDYMDALNQAQTGAIGSINAGQNTGQMQNSLAQQLAAQANGQGPSLAQLQLQQAADQNLKNNAALIAGTKGINPAQAARQVALSNASQGQNLANQSAQLQLQEQLQKQNLLAQTLGTQRGQDIGQQGANTNTFATTGQLQQNQNAQNLQNYWNAQNINSGIAAQNVATNNQIGGQLMGAAGGLLGGMVGGAPTAAATTTGTGAGGGMVASRFAHGGMIRKAMERVAVSPGEKVMNPDGEVSTVPGRERYAGDDPRNDTVVADLREDSIVIPKSKSDDKEKMIDFIKHVKQSSKKKSDLQMVLESHHDLKQKLDEVNYKLGKWMPK